MIRGRVNSKLEAHVSLRVRGPTGVELAVDATVDSGCSGIMTLPATTAAALGLAGIMVGFAVLADGSSCTYDVCPAEVDWDGTWRKVTIWQTGNDPLIGMRLLAGHALYVEVKPGGSVVIDRLP